MIKLFLLLKKKKNAYINEQILKNNKIDHKNIEKQLVNYMKFLRVKENLIQLLKERNKRKLVII